MNSPVDLAPGVPGAATTTPRRRRPRGQSPTELCAEDAALVARARTARDRAIDLETQARAARAEEGDAITTLVERGVALRFLARVLGYASDNSVRLKTRRAGTRA